MARKREKCPRCGEPCEQIVGNVGTPPLCIFCYHEMEQAGPLYRYPEIALSVGAFTRIYDNSKEMFVWTIESVAVKQNSGWNALVGNKFQLYETMLDFKRNHAPHYLAIMKSERRKERAA